MKEQAIKGKTFSLAVNVGEASDKRARQDDIVDTNSLGKERSDVGVTKSGDATTYSRH